MNAVQLRGELLGPAIVEYVDGENVTRLKLPKRATVDSLLRALTCAPDGVSPSDLAAMFPVRTPMRAYHDAAGELRRELRRVGLDLTRAPYRLVRRSGEPVALASDVSLLLAAAALLAEIRQAQAPKNITDTRDSATNRDAAVEEPFALRPLLDQLDVAVDAWRGNKTYAHRASMLGELRMPHQGRLIDLDTRVREERARVAVGLAETSPSTSHVTVAYQAIGDFDHPDHDRDRQRLFARLRSVTDALEEHISQDDPTTEVFLSFPMAGSGDYDDSRRLGQRLVSALQKYCGVREVFWAGATIESDCQFEEPSVGLGRNMPYFRSADRFVMLYPEKLSSGVLVEAGLALGLGMPAVYLVRDREDLPWILQDIGGAGDNKLGRVRVIVYSDEDNLIEKLKSNGPHLFPAASK